jgi:hemerythrin
MQEAHVWNSRLDLGDAALDREHHLQVAMVSALADALEQGRPWMARQLSEQLAGYSNAHFAGEELLMQAAGYDHLPVHSEEHKALLAAVDEIRTLLAGGERELARAALAGHMAASDRRFAQFETAARAPRR